MASSNKHWPSMFKSKPCNTHHHQWQHDIDPSLLSTPAACQRRPHPSVAEREERGPEPKPRWNPKPEQIRILEGIFNSGMVNPPRDEIRKIRAQLQEYGQVGDANVFYWFQNRKSRTKHKHQHQHQRHPIQSSKSLPAATSSLTPASSSSSSSDTSSPHSLNSPFSIHSANVVHISNSPTTSLNVINNQIHFPATAPALDLSPQPFHFPTAQLATGGSPAATAYSQEFCFPELSCENSTVPDPTSAATCSALFLTHDLMSVDHIWSSKKDNDEKMNIQQWPSFNASTLPTPTTTSTTTPTTTTVPSPVNHIQDAGVGYTGAVEADSAEKSTVFINDVAFEVNVGPFNVREAFGEGAVLVHSSGHPLLTDEWGVTHHSLQHGACYYLVHAHVNSVGAGQHS